MAAWIPVLGGIVQILYLILKTKFEKDKEERTRKDELFTGWKEVIKSGDTARITDFLSKLRT